MDLSKIKMVVTDMDGTLLNSDHEVSPRFFELFAALRSKNIIFVAASGRQYNSIIDKLSPIKNDIIVVAENGGFVVAGGQELLSTPLPHSHILESLSLLEAAEGVHPVLCGKHTAYLGAGSEAFVQKLKEYYSKFELVPRLEEVSQEIIKLALFHFEGSEEHIYPYVRPLEKELQVKISGSHWVDISSPNAHKGYALRKLMHLHQVAADELLVFGDYNNDLEMLALSDYSFAMENAHPKVLASAKYRTRSNDEHGVERILEKLL
ncbi:HAD family hydrolase [Maribacter sp. 2307ULW6-5]|uniref:HAD family hydrolase n=1 Tax=Maribacter sp. 2307ULW6-5 TaxID=3386275 RepID=UPI0039BD736A